MGRKEERREKREEEEESSTKEEEFSICAHASGTEECRSARLSGFPPLLLDQWAESSCSVPQDFLHCILGHDWEPSDLHHSFAPRSPFEQAGYRLQQGDRVPG